MNSKAFTLLELIVAIFVLTVGLGATFALIQQTLVSASLVKDKLIASYLAQEGIELVRNIRDTNWLNQVTWDSFLASGCRQMDYNDSALSACTGASLTIDADGFYSYGGAAATKFIRTITINKTDLSLPPDGEVDRIEVSVEVRWVERGRTHTVTALEHLYNWYEKSP